ncbi:MAG: hypothetical protein ABR520_03175 [Mycobacteriales bacterium]
MSLRRALAVIPAASLVMLGLTASTAQAATVVSNPSNTQGWVAQAYDCSDGDLTPQQAFVVGPEDPPLGIGSRELRMGDNVLQTELWRTPNYDGTKIADIQDLQYSTYAASNGVDFQQPPYFRLTVDKDGNGTYDESLFYIPANNGPVVDDAWQTWDMDAGMWGIDGDPGPGGGTTLAAYATANPNAKLVNNNGGQPNGGSMSVIVGCSGDQQRNSTFNTDRVVVDTASTNSTTYDFEPSINVLVSNPSNQRGWTAIAFDCSTDANLTPLQQYVVGPQTPPAGIGSRQLQMDANIYRTEVWRTANHDGTRIADIQQLEYSTYAASNGVDFQQPPYFRLSVDQDGNGTYDESLFFIPANQQPEQPAPVDDAWQTWDLDTGRWNIDGDTGPANGITLAQYATTWPNAQIVNRNGAASNGTPASGGMAIIVGCAGDQQRNSTFNTDRVLLAVANQQPVMYDFEPQVSSTTPPPPPPPPPTTPPPSATPTTASPTPSASASASASPTVTVTATATRTATATATTTTTPSRSAPPGVCAGATQGSVNVSVSPSTVRAGQSSTATVTAPVGSTAELLARTSGQPYAVVRSATVPASGSVSFVLNLGRTVRVAARACGFTSATQPIISVIARVSMDAAGLPGCVVRFNGSTLPVKPGQVVSIYYRSGDSSTLALQTRTDGAGRYVVSRRFLACGHFLGFFARVSNDVHNLAGQSPDKVVFIHR